MTSAPDYSQGVDAERALKFAVQHVRGDRVQIIEGIIEPGRLGYTRVDGPHPFGAVVRLPAPFEVDIDTSGLPSA